MDVIEVMVDKPRACKTAAEIEVGEEFRRTYVITDSDLAHFGAISGDWNPLHFDDKFASASMFGRRIAHGMISVAKFSGIFGMDLPGLGTLWEVQEVRFLAPAYLDEPYTAVVRVTDKDRRRIMLDTWVEDAEGNRLVDGKAVAIPISEAARRKLKGGEA